LTVFVGDTTMALVAEVLDTIVSIQMLKEGRWRLT
jgi:hypothetical protein